MKNYFWRLLALAYSCYAYCIDFIAPAYCAHCRVFLSDRTIYCTTCSDLIKSIASITLPLGNNYTMSVLAASGYKEPLKSLILAKTWSDYTASKQLAQLIWQYSTLKNLSFDYLVPVPLHWTRKARRGYNQAAVIAHELSLLSGKPTLDCVKRIKRTRFQSLLSGTARKHNVHNAFLLNLALHDKISYENKTFVLVDDLMTTGATLQSMGKLLVPLKPCKIYGVVVCRVVAD